jgi:hypothetical protein
MSTVKKCAAHSESTNKPCQRLGSVLVHGKGYCGTHALERQYQATLHPEAANADPVRSWRNQP